MNIDYVDIGLIEGLDSMKFRILPSYVEIARMTYDQATKIKNFTVKNKYGEITWPDYTDVTEVKLDDVIKIEQLEVEIYPENVAKPPKGTKLNKECIVTLNQIKVKLTDHIKQKFGTVTKFVMNQVGAKPDDDVFSYDHISGKLCFKANSK